jgi:hypothetical protein
MAIDFKEKLRLLRERAEQQASSIPTVNENENENENENQSQAEKLNIPELPLTPSTAPIESAIDISGVNTTILLRLAQLEQDLLTQNPGISDNLRLIHRAMLDDPSQVTLLSLEQRALFFQGLMKQTMTVITTAAAKSKSSGTRGKAAKDLNMDDFC